MVANHSLFKIEYKDYIHEQLGGEIEINNDEIIYTGILPQLARSPTNESILANKTNNYMQKLKYQTFHDLKSYHINILRENSNTIAFNRIHKNNYLVAAKPQDMYELKSKLFPRTNQRYQLDNRSSTALIQQETIERSPSLSTLSSNIHTSNFPVTTSEQMSMFSIKIFEDRLEEYLKETFNIKIIIERNIINNKFKEEKSHIIIKLIGQQNNIDNAFKDLMNLFLSLRTRKFDDKTGNKKIIVFFCFLFFL